MQDAEELYEKSRPGRATRAAHRAPPAAGDDAERLQSAPPAPLAIAGTEGLVVIYARCCFPIPSDPIMAYLIERSRRRDPPRNCGNLAEVTASSPTKWIPVAWQAGTDRLFHVEIRVDVANRMGVLAAVAAAISGTQTNIEHVSVEKAKATPRR